MNSPDTFNIILVVVICLAVIVPLGLLSEHYQQRKVQKLAKRSSLARSPLLIPKRFSQKSKHKFVRIYIGFTGATLIIAGFLLTNTSLSGSKFLGVFLCATGTQIALWVLGIRLEILGNVPAEIDAPMIESEENISVESITNIEKPENNSSL